ncbi:hypothetical protein N44_04705 [Microcystis aeruginosa NIES-44]|uniref:Uncharacterized protein n=1 Tax=Microcystis aeruginosa NIES-44 TaxID=449439 RepID=A0A0A1W1Y5_MICAE|nr:hypothetical protein N44_04705 [Microcystis aeruginosa NIES-44]
MCGQFNIIFRFKLFFLILLYIPLKRSHSLEKEPSNVG